MEKSYIEAIGRRKEAVARIRLLKGSGQMSINGMPISEYFKGLVFQKAYQKPLEMTQTLGQYTAMIKVIGGGKKSQLDAVTHGLSRALTILDREQFRPVLKKAGFLTRDPRVKERRKFGLAHKARAKKQSPKR